VEERGLGESRKRNLQKNGKNGKKTGVRASNVQKKDAGPFRKCEGLHQTFGGQLTGKGEARLHIRVRKKEKNGEGKSSGGIRLNTEIGGKDARKVNGWEKHTLKTIYCQDQTNAVSIRDTSETGKGECGVVKFGACWGGEHLLPKRGGELGIVTRGGDRKWGGGRGTCEGETSSWKGLQPRMKGKGRGWKHRGITKSASRH